MSLNPLRELQLATLLLEAASIADVTVDEMLSKSHSATLVHARRIPGWLGILVGFSCGKIARAIYDALKKPVVI